MLAPLYKRIEIFQPYNIPIQPIIISQPDESASIKEKPKITSQKETKKLSFEEDQEHPQNDTASTSGGDLEKLEKYPLKTIFKCFLNKKRKNSNLVKCFKCSIEDCENLFETKEALDKHNKIHNKEIYINT